MDAPIRAVLFDVDGTLYRQTPVRAAMALELASLPWFTGYGRTTPQLWKILRTFRRVREDLRSLGRAAEPLEQLQYTETASQAGCGERDVREAVQAWMFSRPLKYLRRARRTGLDAGIAALRSRGVRLGIFSDYPAREKLSALGLDGAMEFALCATDPAINAFKPHPRGFEHACERWGLAPGEVLYVGDRPDVDASGAAAAGMRCLLVGGRRSSRDGVGSLAELADMVSTPTTGRSPSR